MNMDILESNHEPKLRTLFERVSRMAEFTTVMESTAIFDKWWRAQTTKGAFL